MNIQLINASAPRDAADARMIWLYEGGELFSPAEKLDESTQSLLREMLETQQFTGKEAQIQYVNIADAAKSKKLLFVGLGEKSRFTTGKVRKIVAKSVKELKKYRVKSAEIAFIGIENAAQITPMVSVCVQTAMLADYAFEKFLSKSDKFHLESLHIICDDAHAAAFQAAVTEGVLLGEATNFARDLVNEPANVLVPVTLAEKSVQAGKEAGFDVQVYDEQQIQALGMKAFYEVAKAALNPPRLIVMKYMGKPDKADEIIGFVGKGLTYDSGGLSLKSNEHMIDMKNDMAGAAAVIAAMQAIARAKLPVNVVAVVAACENMLAVHGYRPGDIIGSMGGKSILIKSTDAEGRLTLADAVYYTVHNEKACKVVDIATLTGAASKAFGTLLTAAMGNDAAFYAELEQAAGVSGEKICHVPLMEEYKELIKSDIADLSNSAGPNSPGMIMGGLFIGEFIPDTPWIHLDIAGTAWADKKSDHSPAGGTGVGVRTLYYLAKLLANA